MLKPLKLTEDNLDAMLLQANILKNYFSMMETYLGLVRHNLEHWHKSFIEGK